MAPGSMEAFARVGGDRNPLHRSVLAARMAGLPRPIAHGAWTAARAGAFVVDELCDGDAHRLRDWRVSFLAPVSSGAPLDFEATRVALAPAGVSCRCACAWGTPTSRSARRSLDPPPTALLFPGQGIQRAGLRRTGARARCGAAPTRTRGASSVSRCWRSSSDNPRELRLADGRVVKHPQGVLFRTEFTQAALVALAAAQLAELRAEGALGETATLAAGHSVGEFAALHALGVLDVETAVELVYRRGEAMQAHVPRAADGSSPFRMAIVESPRRAARGRRGRQLQRARAVHDRRHARLVGRVLPGIDVPFHSSWLRGAVDDVPAARRGCGHRSRSSLSGAGCRTSSGASSKPATTWWSCSRSSSPRRCSGSRRSARSRGTRSASSRSPPRTRRS